MLPGQTWSWVDTRARARWPSSAERCYNDGARGAERNVPVTDITTGGRRMEHGGGTRDRVCGGLFGCGGEDDRRYMASADAVDGALTSKTRDRLEQMDELSQEGLDPYVSSYRVSRRRVVGAGGLLGVLASVAPAGLLAACGMLKSLESPPKMSASFGGRIHTVESSAQTVQLGVFDGTRPNIVEIDSGDTVVYPNTWTHFLNRFQRGSTIEQLAQYRRENPGK